MNFATVAERELTKLHEHLAAIGSDMAAEAKAPVGMYCTLMNAMGEVRMIRTAIASGMSNKGGVLNGLRNLRLAVEGTCKAWGTNPSVKYVQDMAEAVGKYADAVTGW